MMLLAAATAALDSNSFSSPLLPSGCAPRLSSAVSSRTTRTRSVPGRAASSSLLSLSALRRAHRRSWLTNGDAHHSLRCQYHRLGATPEYVDGPSDGRYHPFEEITDALQPNDGEPARLTDAESARTIVEVNNKATVMISTLVDDGVHERIILPEFPYLTDENGDIYFEVDNDDVLLESIIGDDKITHVIIGLDNTQVLSDMELAAASASDFGPEDEVSDDESDFDDDYDEEGVFAIEDGDEDDGNNDSEEAPDGWSNLETMKSCHPLYFARTIAEAATKSNIEWLDRPPASLILEGHLRPAFAEESTMVARHISSEQEKDRKKAGATFFKLEVMTIELITAYGTEPKVKISEYRKVRPDIIAHSAPNIISRLRASGDKITQALKSLCWRCKAIQVEEAAVIGVDNLGIDLRVCSGTQVQTLRFAFHTKATSEFGAEKQIHELLFPRVHQEGQSPQARQKES